MLQKGHANAQRTVASTTKKKRVSSGDSHVQDATVVHERTPRVRRPRKSAPRKDNQPSSYIDYISAHTRRSYAPAAQEEPIVEVDDMRWQRADVLFLMALTLTLLAIGFAVGRLL